MGVSVNLFDLAGKTAVITGATGNLGKSMSSVLAGQGCSLILAVRDKDKGETFASSLASEYGTETLVLTWDASDADSIKKLALAAKTWKGRVDILVNNAGGSSNTSSRHFFDRSDADIRYTLEVNLISVLFCCREFGKIMKEQGGGKIINIASIAGMVGRDRRMYEKAGFNEQVLEYAAAKGGVISLTRDLAAMLAPAGVNVNAVSPGGFRHGTSEKFAELYGDRTPLGRMGHTATDLNGAVIFLASAASDYVTGHNLAVDGGFTSWQ
jgi:NAD(P)-dependent dehydrogenase (short-subunit alcohol dehydrogenase family)